MKHSYLKILGQANKNDITDTRIQQQEFGDRQEIQDLRFKIKKLYYKKRALYVDTLIEMLQQNKKPIDDALQLKLPSDIQKQRQQYFTINEKFKKRRQMLQENAQEEDQLLKQEPFGSVKERIFKKYKLKRKYVQQMKQNIVLDDNLETQKKLILDIYKDKLKEYYVLNDYQYVNNYNYNQQNHMNIKTSTVVQNRPNLYLNRNYQGSVDFLNNNIYGKGFNTHYNDYDVKSSPNTRFLDPYLNSNQNPYNNQSKQSIVIQTHTNPPQTGNYMKINDPNLDFNYQNNHKSNNKMNEVLHDLNQTDKQFSIKEKQKRLNKSFQQSGYKNYLLEQKQQLQQQKKRMMKLTEQANKVIHNQNLTDSEQQKQVKSEYTNNNKLTRNMDSKNTLSRNKFSKNYESEEILNQSLSIDESTKQINQIKCLFTQLIQLFILSQILKFQLHYRTFEMISKLYQYASQQYKQKILVQEPININTFTIVVKSLLRDDYQLKSQVDVIVNKIFRTKNNLLFQDVTRQLQSLLNKKQVQILEPIENRQQVDRTIQKTKRLFVTWISMSYFIHKIKQILKKKQFIVATIMKQCAQEYDSQSFQPSLLTQFFYEGSTSQTQRIKITIFFKHILGNQLKRKNFISWYSNEDVFHSRYQRIGAKLNKSKDKF